MIDWSQPWLIDDIAGLRAALLAPGASGQRSVVWRMLLRSARRAPKSYPWYTAFVALITRDAGDIARARQVLAAYLGKLDAVQFTSGLQLHFWCFAFPHAKWSLMFQWLCSIGAYDDDERRAITAQLVCFQFTNMHYGLRTKPEPACVDNQTLALALSNALVGMVFEGHSALAEPLRHDGLRRLPAILGALPASGYSGEGSAYMDGVIGPAVTLAVEVLNRARGRDDGLWHTPQPGDTPPIAALRMVAREVLPGGLLLPWDNYGYQFGVRSPLAYGAARTGEALFFEALAACIWSYDIGVGWAYDDLVWTVIWWPAAAAPHEQAGGWFEEQVGGALWSADRQRGVVQIWDDSAPGIPTRAHVNPNAVLFHAFGVPLSADGAADGQGCARFAFADTWREVSYLSLDAPVRYNYGDGCGGAHSVVLFDGWEGLRLHQDGPQRGVAGHAPALLHCDVAPFYRESVPDVRRVERRTLLLGERFIVIEDLIEAAHEHDVTARFVVRPELTPTDCGVRIVTPEGIALQLVEVLHAATFRCEAVAGFPTRPDGRSVVADVVQRGRQVRWLFVALAEPTRVAHRLTALQAIADPAGVLDDAHACRLLRASPLRLDGQLPPHLERDLPLARTWWYRATLRRPAGAAWLRLPLGLARPRLLLDGRPVDLAPWASSLALLPPDVPLPDWLAVDAVFELVLRSDVPLSHYEGGGDGTLGLCGGFALCLPVANEQIRAASFADGVLMVQTDHALHRWPYALLPADAATSGG